MRYQSNKRFQAGTSMVYVLAALIVTGFIGGAMIKMMGSERTANALYATSASARNAAKSGIIAAIHKFEDAGKVDAVTIPLLQKWIDNPLNPPELIASGTIGADQKYTTKLMAFDPKKFNITLMSEGIGKGGARATITSVYYLDGLYYDQPKGNVPTNALQLDNGNFEFNCNVEVFGNTSVKNKITMNNGWVKFHGHFRIDTMDDGSVEKTYFNQPIEFDSGAYFAGNIEPSNTMLFKGNVGFAGNVKCAPSRLKFENAGDSVYFSGGYQTNSSEGRINLADDVLFLYNSSSSYKTKVSSAVLMGLNVFANKNTQTSPVVPSTPAPLKENIDYLVSSVFHKRDTTVHLNVDLIDTIFKTFTYSSHETITATKLNNWYNAEIAKTTGRKLWNGYLVLKFDPGGNLYYPFSDDGTKFNGKVIIINNDKKMHPSSFYESGPNGVTVLYFNDYNTTDPIFGGVEYFRGLIYVNKATNGGLVFQQNIDSEIDGSVYYSKKALSKFDGVGKTTTFRYNKPIMDDLAILGIFTSKSDITTDLSLKTSHSNPIASLVSQSL